MLTFFAVPTHSASSEDDLAGADGSENEDDESDPELGTVFSLIYGAMFLF